MITETLNKLTELHLAATPGPWKPRTVRVTYGHGDYGEEAAGPDAYAHPKTQVTADAELIAALRNAYPELIQHIDSLEKALRQFATYCPLTRYEAPGVRGFYSTVQDDEGFEHSDHPELSAWIELHPEVLDAD